ncbi:Chromosome_segregation ATPase [Hexamita inflata]|uniref:Chromosome segregation ATPase n=1 Tax=Hexamita inflata TaxID=28002 RepID=A0AA86V138_9EUKA|nr:Chromosome segregation ATPase [Hexamita inflata]
MSHLENVNMSLPRWVLDIIQSHPNDELREVFSINRHPCMYLNPGTILRVHIQNFLTHQNKIIDFKMPVTLIHGQNGSGKSSVLQAIHFCLLGDKSKIRENVKNFADLKTMAKKVGSNETDRAGTSTVTVYFAGQQAIRRKIESSDATSIWFTDFTDKHYRKIKQKEAAVILQGLRHFPNNRVTMITQSDMKLQAKMDAKERYKVFQESSLLAEITEKTTMTLETAQQNQNDLIKLKNEREVKRQKRDEVVQQLKDLENVKEMLCQIGDYQIQSDSIDTFLDKLTLDEKNDELLKAHKELKRHQKEIAVLEEAKNNSEKQYLQEQIKLRQIQTEYRKLINEKDDIQQDYQKSQTEMQQIEVQKTPLVSKIQETKDRIRQLQTLIKKLKCELNEPEPVFTLIKPEIPEQYEELKKQSKETEVEQNKLTQQKQQLESQYRQLTKQKEDIESIHNNAKNALNYNKDQITLKKQKLEDIERNVAKTLQHINALSAHDRQLYEELRRESKVIGPGSAFVSIKEEYEYIQEVIKRYIQPNNLKFVVCLKQNEKSMDRVPKKYTSTTLMNIERIQDNRQYFNDLQSRLDFKIVPLTDILHITNDLVNFTLIIKRRIDKVVVIDKIEDVQKLFNLDQTLTVLPRNAEAILTFQNGSQVSQPAYPQPQINDAGGSQLYCHSAKNVKELQQELYKLEADQQDLQVRLNETTEQLTQVDEISLNIQEINKQKEDIDRKLNQIIRQLNEIKQQQQNIMNSFRKELDLYEREKSNFQQKLMQRENCQKDLDQHQQSIQTGETTLKNNELTIQNLDIKLKSAQEACQQIKQVRDEKQLEIEKIKQEEQLQNQIMENFNQNQIQIQIQKLSSEEQLILKQIKIFQSNYDILNNKYIESAKKQLEEANRIKNGLSDVSISLTSLTGCNNDSTMFLQLLFEKDVEKLTKNGELDINGLRERMTSKKEQLQKEILELSSQMQRIEQEIGQTLREVNERHARVVNEYETIKKTYLDQKDASEKIIPVVVDQIARIATLREQCETEMMSWFDKQVALLKIQTKLEFKQSKLPDPGQFGIELRMLSEKTQKLFEQFVSKQQEYYQQGEIRIAGQQRDVNSFSGGEGTFTALCFITACCKVIQSSYLQIDEWDVYMDMSRRTASFKMLMDVIMKSGLQCVLVTPNDVDLKDVSLEADVGKLIGVVRLEAVARGV